MQRSQVLEENVFARKRKIWLMIDLRAKKETYFTQLKFKYIHTNISRTIFEQLTIKNNSKMHNFCYSFWIWNCIIFQHLGLILKHIFDTMWKLPTSIDVFIICLVVMGSICFSFYQLMGLLHPILFNCFLENWTRYVLM